MKVLVFGPSGSGKTYVSSQLQNQGINAIDADAVEGLSSWFDWQGNKVSYDVNADAEFLDNHSFLWDKEFLKTYLSDHDEIYLFGAAGNVFDVLDLFDAVYFLKVPPDLQKERLMHESRENPMGSTEFQRERAVTWGNELEQEARTNNIPFIDAELEPQEMLSIIRSA